MTVVKKQKLKCKTDLSCIVEIVQKTTILVIYPHFEEVRGGVEPWLMALWKARVRLPIRHN